MEEDTDCLDLPEIEEMTEKYNIRLRNITQWKLLETGKERREHAKNYAAMYASYVPKPGWSIADQ
jgi:hypothetical protein